MKQLLLAFAFLFLCFSGCNSTKPEGCPCDPCHCENCTCDVNGCDCSTCTCGMGDAIGVPADDSNRAYLTVYGQKGEKTFETLCQWGRQTRGTHYAEITTDDPMAERMGGVIQPPRVVITDSTGKTLYKGVPETYAEFRNRFNSSCPNGNCRPQPQPEPVAPPSVTPPPVLDPIPDTDEGGNSLPVWVYIVGGFVAAGAGGFTWYKNRYFPG